jgi:hypothetical protein
VTSPTDLTALLARESRSLVERLRLWTPARWEAAAPPWGTRADLVHHLCRCFVDAAAETDLPLPRLDSPLALPDQLAVTADDLVRRADPDQARAQTAHLLLHRTDLLGDDIPQTLAPALSLDSPEDVLSLGRRTCGSSQGGGTGPAYSDDESGGRTASVST